jgi:hypothetical protein
VNVAGVKYVGAEPGSAPTFGFAFLHNEVKKVKEKNLVPLRSAIGMLEYWNTGMMGWRPSDK